MIRPTSGTALEIKTTGGFRHEEKGAVKKQRQDRRGHSEKGGLFKLREREGKRAQKSKPGVKPAEKDGE